MSTRAQILAEIAAQFPDNTTGLITPAKLRQVVEDIANSYNNLTDEPAVPTSRTVNGHALSSNVTVTAADVGLGSVENTALSTWTGSANLATVGTITAGTWHGSAIADTYISSAPTWNAKVSFPGFGTTAGTAAEGNDARLSDARTPLAHTQAWSTITTTPTTLAGYGITDAQPLDSDLTSIAALTTTAFGRSLLTQADAAATRTTIGAGTSSFDGAYASLTGIPSTFTPAAHNQAWSTITTTPTTLSGYGITDAQGLDSDLTALAGLSSNGLIARTADGAAATRTITGTTNQVIVSDGDGVAGNPTLSLPQSIATTSTPQFARLGIGVSPSAACLEIDSGTGERPSPITNNGIRMSVSDSAQNSIESCGWGAAPLRIVGRRAGGTRADPTAVAGGLSLLNLEGTGYDGTTHQSSPAAAINLLTNGDWSGTNRGTKITLQGTPLDSTTLATWATLANGNVGIGTTSPSAQLHLRSASDNIVEAIRLDNPTNSGDNGSKIVWRNADVSKDAAFFAARRIGTTTGIALTFGTAEAWSTAAATEKMRIAGNGNVGIGNTNPQRKLEVVGDSNGNGIRVTGTTGTVGAFTAEGTTVKIGADNAAATRVLVDAGSSNASGYVALNGGSSGYIQFATGGTERMRIAADGAVKLNSYGAGTLQTDSAGNVTASSDARLKNVTGSFTRGLNDVLKLTPRTYHWNEKSGMNTEDENVGFIAQEVQDAIPEAVGTMKTTDYEEDDAATGKKVRKSKREAAEYLTLSDRPLIAALVNAVKELKAENDTLRARVSALENGKAAK